MNDILPLIWSQVDAIDPILPERIVATWPAAVRAQLAASGIVQPAEDASSVLCPECFEHEEEVIALERPDGQRRLMIPCPQVLRVEVPFALLQQWAISVSSLVTQVALCLQLTGEPLELIPGRLWRAGRTRWAGAKRDVLFARGLAWQDAAGLCAAIRRSTRPIAFVASHVPEASTWSGHAPTVLVLQQFSSLQEGQLELDHEAIAAAVADIETAAADAPSTFTVEQLKQVVRQQVKADARTQLTDDVFAEAYRREGSYRKAASYLAQQTGQEITKDQVAFAVNRLGGVAATVRDHDSESIVRRVARRGRRGRSNSTVEVRDL
jgi:hypothetical protein